MPDEEIFEPCRLRPPVDGARNAPERLKHDPVPAALIAENGAPSSDAGHPAVGRAPHGDGAGPRDQQDAWTVSERALEGRLHIGADADRRSETSLDERVPGLRAHVRAPGAGHACPERSGRKLEAGRPHGHADGVGHDLGRRLHRRCRDDHSRAPAACQLAPGLVDDDGLRVAPAYIDTYEVVAHINSSAERPSPPASRS